MFLWSLLLIMALFLASSNSLFMSCLSLVMSAVFLGINFSAFHMNWILYTTILLYVGGMMILFMYMCCLSSSAKIESTNFSLVLFVMSLLTILFFISFENNYSSSGFNLANIYSLFTSKSEIILIFFSIYLLVGLLYSMFFMEKFHGPLKPMN